MMPKLRISARVICCLVLVMITLGCRGPGAPSPPSIPMTLYENTEHGFSIKYPEGWIESMRGVGTYFSLEFKDPEGRLTASVSLEYKTERIILADLVSEAKAYMESMPQYELISEGDTVIAEGILGYELVGRGDLGRGKVEKFRFVTLAREQQGFWVRVSGEPAEFDQQARIIDAIVDSFKLLPTYTFVPPTPSPGGIYTSAEYGFSLTYPAGWVESPTGRPGEIISLASPEGLPSVSVSLSPVGEGTTLTEFGPQLAQDLGQHWGDYELISEGEITLDDGTPAYEIVFSGTMEGYTLKAKYGIVIQETQAFFIMGFSMPARFEQDEAVLDEVIHSFHLELPAPEVVVGEEEPTIAAPRLQNPITLDGGISGNEWEDAGQLPLTFVYTHGESSLTYPGVIYLKHDGSCLWICIRVQDDDEDKFPALGDYAAILFDASGDGEIGSGDDSAIIHHGMDAEDLRPDEDGVWLSDTEFGGNNDVAGQSGWASGWYTYEMRKPLNSGDTNGYDIAISPGDTILSGSCYWDTGETTEHSAEAGSFYIELEA